MIIIIIPSTIKTWALKDYSETSTGVTGARNGRPHVVCHPWVVIGAGLDRFGGISARGEEARLAGYWTGSPANKKVIGQK